MTTFAEFGLAEAITRALTEEKYVTPTPIQTQTIPLVMTGGDIIGIAQTGTGKTAAFALPILNRLAANPVRAERKTCRVLVLSPTRELSGQILDSFRAYGRHLRLQTALAIGGVPMGRQVRDLMNGLDILVATPGRLLDLVQQNALRLSGVEVLVLDEADRMLDMGFIHDIRKIVAKTPSQRQTLMFSATMPKEIAELAAHMLKNPQKVAVTPEATTVERIDQRVIHLDQAPSRTCCRKSCAPRRSIARSSSPAPSTAPTRWFARSTRAASPPRPSTATSRRTSASACSPPSARASVRTLVATDIAARGIDVDGVSHVINYDLPNIPESYVHRIGRTARAGAEGIAISFCSRDEAPFLRDIERLIRITIPSTDRRTDRRTAADAGRRGRTPRHADANGQRRRQEPPPQAASALPRQRPEPAAAGTARTGRGHGRPKAGRQSNPDQIASVGFMRSTVRERAKSPADAGGAAR